MEMLWDLHIIHDKSLEKEKEEGWSLPLHSAFSRRANYSALAATT